MSDRPEQLKRKWEYAQAYLRAFEVLAATPETEPDLYWTGPSYHLLGMALELTFKAFLQEVSDEVPKKTHDVNCLYSTVRTKLPDPIDFERSLGEQCKRHWDLPELLRNRLSDDLKAQVSYYVVWIHIDLLNRTFYQDSDSGESFKTRYAPQTDTRFFPINTALLTLTCNELRSIATAQ